MERNTRTYLVLIALLYGPCLGKPGDTFKKYGKDFDMVSRHLPKIFKFSAIKKRLM